MFPATSPLRPLALAAGCQPSLILARRSQAAHDDAVSSLALRNNRLVPPLLKPVFLFPSRSLELTNGGRIQVSGAWDCTVKLWDCSPSGIGKIPVAHLGEHEREVVAVSLGQEGSLAASLSADGAVSWDDAGVV